MERRGGKGAGTVPSRNMPGLREPGKGTLNARTENEHHHASACHKNAIPFYQVLRQSSFIILQENSIRYLVR